MVYRRSIHPRAVVRGFLECRYNKSFVLKLAGMKIAVGTTSKHKLEFLGEVLKNLDIKAKIVPVEADSEVSNQPLSESETETGSLNRAEGALRKVESADYGLGIEVGYHQNGQGGKIITKNQNLGDFVREFKKDDNKKHVTLIREMIIFRKELIMEATRNVLLNYLLKNEY